MGKIYLNNPEDLDLLLSILKEKLQEEYGKLGNLMDGFNIERVRSRIMVLKEHIALLELEHKKAEELKENFK